MDFYPSQSHLFTEFIIYQHKTLKKKSIPGLIIRIKKDVIKHSFLKGWVYKKETNYKTMNGWPFFHFTTRDNGLFQYTFSFLWL